MIQIGNKEVDSITIGGKEVQTITIGGKTAYEKQQHEIDYFYIENTYSGTNTITLKSDTSGTPSSGTYATSVQYSKDKSTWTTLTFTAGGSNTITMNQGEKVYFRNNSGKWNSKNFYTSFNGSKSHKVGGNLNTLINYSNLNSASLSNYSFLRMFYVNRNIVDAGLLILPFTNLTQHCYDNMFRGCTSLTTAPELPATTLYVYCYDSMFYGCTSLTTTPTLPATTLPNYCYNSMFNSCTNLNSITTYANDKSAQGCTNNWVDGVAASGDFYNLGSATYSSGKSGIPSGWTEHKLKMTDVVLTPATGTEYSVTANLEWSSNLTWTSAEIDISNSDQGAGNRNATLTFTPSEVSNGVLTTTNNIDIYFQDPDTWFTLTVYNGNTIVDTQYITYTTS